MDLSGPPQRAGFHQRVAALRGAGLTEREVAAGLGITQPAVQAAAKLGRRMASEGSPDPYTLLATPPADERKTVRYRHPRYHFALPAGLTQSTRRPDLDADARNPPTPPAPPAGAFRSHPQGVPK